MNDPGAKRSSTPPVWCGTEAVTVWTPPSGAPSSRSIGMVSGTRFCCQPTPPRGETSANPGGTGSRAATTSRSGPPTGLQGARAHLLVGAAPAPRAPAEPPAGRRRCRSVKVSSKWKSCRNVSTVSRPWIVTGPGAVDRPVEPDAAERQPEDLDLEAGADVRVHVERRELDDRVDAR